MWTLNGLAVVVQIFRRHSSVPVLWFMGGIIALQSQDPNLLTNRDIRRCKKSWKVLSGNLAHHIRLARRPDPISQNIKLLDLLSAPFIDAECQGGLSTLTNHESFITSMLSLIEESFLQFKSSARYEEKIIFFVHTILEDSDVTFSHICVFKDILLHALEELLGSRYDTDTHQSWTRLLATLLVKTRAPFLKSRSGASAAVSSPEHSERMFASSINVVNFD
jgi:hypothetical protein